MYLAILQVTNLIFRRENGVKLIEKIYIEYFSIDWEDLSKIGELNADNST